MRRPGSRRYGAHMTRSRARILIAGAVVIGLGLAGRMLPGALGDVVGGMLYAVLVYLALALISPTRKAWRLALIAAGIGVAIEAAQLTGLPAELASVFPPARLVFGSTFVVSDLLIAVVGAALAPLTDLVTRPSDSVA